MPFWRLACRLSPAAIMKAVASSTFDGQRKLTMHGRSPLDDPENARFAWARYRSIMKGMAAFSTVVVAVALSVLYWQIGFVSIHLYIASALGIWLTIMLMAALMGLVFLSSGTGHDESIEDRLGDERNR
jgi:hypothetical protein